MVQNLTIVWSSIRQASKLQLADIQAAGTQIISRIRIEDVSEPAQKASKSEKSNHRSRPRSMSRSLVVFHTWSLPCPIKAGSNPKEKILRMQGSISRRAAGFNPPRRFSTHALRECQYSPSGLTSNILNVVGSATKHHGFSPRSE